MFHQRKNKTYESYREEMNTKVWKDTQEALTQQVTELTIKLDDLQRRLSSKELSFKEAGKVLQQIRASSVLEHHHHDNDDDLIFCLDLVETLWECVHSDGLSCSEFSELLSNMLGRPASHFEVLFQKMDADGDETLSWGEYVSFLSQQQAHLWDQQESKHVSYYRENSTALFNCGNNQQMFGKICILPGEATSKCTLNSAKYAMLTSDNSIQVRNAESLQLESCIDMTLRPKKAKTASFHREHQSSAKFSFDATTMRNRAAQQEAKKNKQVVQCTNLCAIRRANDDGITRLAISFMDRSVNLYAPSFTASKDRKPIYLQSPLERKQHNNRMHYHLENGFFALDIPQCMELFSEQDNTLLVGETYGSIGLYNYMDHNCLVRVNKHGANSSGPCVVKQVTKVPRIGVVSCAMDTLIMVTDPTKWITVRTLSGHTRGVFSTAFSLNHRMLVSAGYDRNIIMWDPYIKKPLGFLKGHVSTVVGVLINDQTNQIITASKDKKVKGRSNIQIAADSEG